MPIRIAEPGRYGRGLSVASYPGNSIVQPLGWSGSPLTLSLTDDFNGSANASPDTAIWDFWNQNTSRTGNQGSYMLRAENTYLDGSGALVVRITNSDIGYGAEQSAGGLQSKTQFGPGSFFECRAKQSSVDPGHFGCWSQNLANAGEHEIDLAEAISGVMQCNVINGGYGGGFTQNPYSWTAAGIDQFSWNVYGYYWRTTGYDFYCNGTLMHTDTRTTQTTATQVFRATQEWDWGAGTNCHGYVDYIRIWVP